MAAQLTTTYLISAEIAFTCYTVKASTWRRRTFSVPLARKNAFLPLCFCRIYSIRSCSYLGSTTLSSI